MLEMVDNNEFSHVLESLSTCSIDPRRVVEFKAGASKLEDLPNIRMKFLQYRCHLSRGENNMLRANMEITTHLDKNKKQKKDYPRKEEWD